jgi:hypothetical protein
MSDTDDASPPNADTGENDEQPGPLPMNIVLLDQGIREVREALAEMYARLNAITRLIIQRQYPEETFETIYAVPENKIIIDGLKERVSRHYREKLEVRLSVLLQIRQEKIDGTWPLIEVSPDQLKTLQRPQDADNAPPAGGESDG